MLIDDLFERVADVFKLPPILLSKKIQLNLRLGIPSHYLAIKTMFDNTEGTVWRVSMTHRNVTNLQRKFENIALTSKAMLYGDNPDLPKDEIYILFVPNKYFSGETASLHLLESNNILALAFVYRSW